ncbi:MAG TPA: hypothetical protein VFC44_02025 [Candidatus Saccharimonadales bacterium]|nr:hypothetical protein [Candidatus Saccharimonadales bacterium]
METPSLSKYTISFGLSLALASVANALLVIAKEKIPRVMAALQGMTGHHWISHSSIVLVLFVAFGWIFAQANGGRGPGISVRGLLCVLVSGVLTGALLILGFYLTAG